MCEWMVVTVVQEQTQMDGLSRLEAARQQLHESEESAQDTMMHLQAQREVLQRARDNVRVGGRWAGLVVLRGTCRVVDIVWWFGALYVCHVFTVSNVRAGALHRPRR